MSEFIYIYQKKNRAYFCEILKTTFNDAFVLAYFM